MCSGITFCRSVVTKVLITTRARCVFPVQDSKIEKLFQSIVGQQRSDLIAAD